MITNIYLLYAWFAGTLAAFRMYWGTINSSYKSLMGVLTSFTRAGGAAQRVLSLLDATPEIDGNAGMADAGGLLSCLLK